MHCNTLIITFGLTLAAHSSAAPLSELVADMRPLSTVVSSAPASTATGIANITAGKVPDRKHTPTCEHSHNASHTTTTSHGAQNMTSGTRGPTKGYGRAAKALGNPPSPYPGFNASAYSPPHAVLAHNHTGDYCDHPSHYNSTITDATDGKMIDPRMFDARASSLHNHTKCHCAHPSHLYNGTHTRHACEFNGTHNNSDYDCTHTSHHNGTGVPEYSYKRDTTLVPRVDVTVCLGADCKSTKIVTADLSSAGQVEGVHAKDTKRMAKRRDTEISYEDVVR